MYYRCVPNINYWLIDDFEEVRHCGFFVGHTDPLRADELLENQQIGTFFLSLSHGTNACSTFVFYFVGADGEPRSIDVLNAYVNGNLARVLYLVDSGKHTYYAPSVLSLVPLLARHLRHPYNVLTLQEHDAVDRLPNTREDAEAKLESYDDDDSILAFFSRPRGPSTKSRQTLFRH